MKQQLTKQITLGTDPYTGKRIRKRIYANSTAGLAQAEKDAIRQFAKSGITANMTWQQYRDQWLDAYCANLQPITVYCYKSCLKKLDHLNFVRMDRITRTDLQKVMNECWDHPNMASKLGMLLNSIWRSAVLDGIVKVNIGEKLKRPKRYKSRKRAFTAQELEALGKVQLKTLDRFLADLLLQFGLRPQEAFAISITSFNRKNRTLTIDKAVGYNQQTPFIKPTKTGVTRVLPVPDSFWKKIPKINTLYYFVYPDGSLWKRAQTREAAIHIQKAVNEWLGGNDDLKVTDLTLYTFRHNKATQLYYLSNVSLKKKAEYMGHSEIMFLNTYSHLAEENEDIEALRKAI